LQLNSAEFGRLRIDNARKSPMIRRPNLDVSMGIAASLQQTGGGLFGAFKLTGDDTTRSISARHFESPLSARAADMYKRAE
jgi:hypothetical protein